jgi:uncharacterized protein
MVPRTFGDEFPAAQFGLTVVIALVSFLFFMLLSLVLAIPIFGIGISDLTKMGDLSNPQNINLLKYFQIVQSVGLFIIPPFFLAKLFSGKSFAYLHVEVLPSAINVGLVVCIMVFAIPVINLLATANSMIKFPEYLSGLEHYMMNKENEAKDITDAFLKVSSVGGLVVNLIMMGVVAAVGEELLFRGVLQCIFSNWTKSFHWGIVISAFIFSALHMQFYGFFPRWFLGIMFGYMFVWSGSLWLPIFAHFLNNSIAVITYYFINKGIVNEKAADIGSTTDILPYTVLFTFLTGFAIYFLYKNRNFPSLSNSSEI